MSRKPPGYYGSTDYGPDSFGGSDFDDFPTEDTPRDEDDMGLILDITSDHVGAEARRESFTITVEEDRKNAFVYASQNVHDEDPCGVCAGSGTVEVTGTYATPLSTSPCTTCNGTGLKSGYPRSVTLELSWRNLPDIELAVQELRAHVIKNGIPCGPPGSVLVYKRLEYDFLMADVQRALVPAFPERHEEMMSRLRARSKERLLPYLTHQANCCTNNEPEPGVCTCGLNKLLSSLHDEGRR